MNEPRPRHRHTKPPSFRAIEKRLKRVLVAVAVAVIPRLYLAYMRLVWATSRVETIGLTPHVMRQRYGKAVYALWHDEVFFVAYAFAEYSGTTLASRGDFGEVITRMLELCGFTVFRGGSSSGRQRRSLGVVDEMIAHMNQHVGVVYGITTDGSAGPRFSMKPGVARIAVGCGSPAAVERTWCRRYFRLKTWDRTIVPLPFNHIVHVFSGPYWAPEEAAHDDEVFHRFVDELENALLEATWTARARIEGESSPDLLEGFPEGWALSPGGLVLDRDPGHVPGARGEPTSDRRLAKTGA